MTDSSPPRTLRDEIAQVIAAAHIELLPSTLSELERVLVSTYVGYEVIADALLASFDIRPRLCNE